MSQEKINNNPPLSTPEGTASDPGTYAPKKASIYTMQAWLDLELNDNEKNAVIGTSNNPLVRTGTKNLIEAAEKSFKTTFLLRLLAGLSCGEAAFPQLPVPKPRRVLYLHGELSNAEIKERTASAAESLASKDFTNFWQGRVQDAHLVETAGRDALRKLVETYEPDDLAIDPWQSFIVGCEENSYKEMSEATKFCSELIEEYGITLWIPIHLGKVRSKGARGHSTIAGWRDTRFQLARHESRITVTVDPRWSKPPEPFSLGFRDGTVWADGRTQTPGLPKFSDQTIKIREFVEDNGGKISIESLQSHLRLSSKDAFRKALARAEQQGAIRKGAQSVALPLKPTEDHKAFPQ